MYLTTVHLGRQNSSKRKALVGIRILLKKIVFGGRRRPIPSERDLSSLNLSIN